MPHRLALRTLPAALVLLFLAAGCSDPRTPPRAAAPAVFPVPQSVRPLPARVSIPAHVRVVTTAASDPAAVATAKAALRRSGVSDFAPSASPLTVYVGGNRAAERSLGVKGAAGLPPGGYLLAAGHGREGRAAIVLDGVDRAGQFYAAQTLRQLLGGRRSLQGVVVRDWPSFPMRGVVEGFFGAPWTLAERLSMLDFLGSHKLNVYMFGPKDDSYLRRHWDVPFPTSSRLAIRTLVARASRNHVTFNLMVSPGLSICYSSPADQQRLIQKLEVAWGLGVRSFSIALDDLKTPRRPHCVSDLAFLRRPGGLAAAQAELINAIETRFIATHPGAAPLIAVPTEYNGLESTPYKRAFAAGLSPDVIVMWTGRNGISDAIDSPQAAAARRIYRHKILIWDNFFVNDYALGNLVLSPLERHDATLPRWTLGLAADPMVQAESSKIGLFTVADYTWNPMAYDPMRSWEASLREFAGGDPAGTAALRQFADANWGSPVTHAQAPSLAAAIDSFWSDWRRGDASAAARLDARLRALEGTPVVIRARVPNPGFLAESGAWLNATRAWAATARVALDLLTARYHGETAQALADEVKLPGLTANAQQYSTFKTQTRLADGVIDRFIEDAQLYRAPEVRGRR